MDLEYCSYQMAADAQRISALAEGVDIVQARWKPDEASWSILEVVCHLLDEEREDFRVRIDYTIHRPGESWPGIDPAGWVTSRRYNEQDLPASLAAFLQERQASLAWLQELQEPDWKTTYQAPWGSITAGDLLASWVAHDLLHMRQLVELHWLFKEEALKPYSTDYAGSW